MLRQLAAIFDSPNAFSRRPVVDERFESNVPGLFVVGDLAGAPVVKLAMEQGHHVAEYIASLSDARATDTGAFDVVVIGAGAAGLNAALTLQGRGLRVLVIEKSKIANTIEDFPEGKWIYAEPESRPVIGKLWLEGASKENLLGRWNAAVREHRLDVRTGEAVVAVTRSGGHFDVRTDQSALRARRVILATGQRGNPRWLGVPGEDRPRISHRLYSPSHYRGEQVVVIGGGNSAVEAALALADARARVTLVHRGETFERLFKDNRRRLAEAQAERRVDVRSASRVSAFDEETCTVEGERVPYDHAFILIGAEPPVAFLRSLGLHLENDWTGNPYAAAALTFGVLCGLAWFWPVALIAAATLLWSAVKGGNRFALLGVSFLISYTIYGAKVGPGAEFWPYRGWGYKAFSFFDRGIGFWYTVAYTLVMTVFGLRAMKRWGLDRGDKFQVWRYVSLLSFQWIFFFLIPEFLFQYAVKYEWVGSLAKDPQFVNAAWRSYGLIYAWPLFFYTFFDSPHQIWIVWGALLSFGVIPILTLFHGKRYCSWICGCGGLAETLGDRWRHLAPKGSEAIKWEWMNAIVLVAASLITIAATAADVWSMLREGSGFARYWYKLIVDVWLVGIIPVTLYPFLGGKVWCRYWCPLAKMMQIFSSAFTRFKASRFAIRSSDKCIACGECTRYCQVGIDVMNYALTQRVLDNSNSSCIGCGICVTVCPMGVLSFADQADTKLVQIQRTA